MLSDTITLQELLQFLPEKDKSIGDKKKEEKHTRVNFGGSYKVVDEKHISNQLQLASCLFGVKTDKLVELLKKTKPEVLSEKMWSELQNSKSYGIVDEDEAEKVADEYGYHYNDALIAFTNDRDISYPVIVQRGSEKPHLISGEPELLFARAFGIRIEALVIKI